MRILHTADWHMNRKLGWQPLNQDICHSLEQIATYLDDYAVDVMVVAGDVLEKTSRIEEMKQAVQDIKRIFTPFLKRGGTILAVSGNHDNETFFETLRDALELVSPGHSGVNGTNATGRLYIAPNARTVRLADREGNVVQFVLMPYPTSRAYLFGPTAQYERIEEKNRGIQQVFQMRLAELISRLDDQLHSVLVSHIHVRGVQAHELFRLSEVEDVIFEQNEIPTHWDYVAYGHIHKPQPALPGATHILYSGSIVKLDRNEQSDEKSVVFCEINQSGRVGEPERLPLTTTPMHHVEITHPDIQIQQLETQYPDHNNALIHYTLHWDPNKHNQDALHEAIRKIFPRCYGRDVREIGRVPAHQIAFQAQQIHNVVTNVREYLDLYLKGHPNRNELLAAAEKLLVEEI